MVGTLSEEEKLYGLVTKTLDCVDVRRARDRAGRVQRG